jgi:hypothetical protein
MDAGLVNVCFSLTYLTCLVTGGAGDKCPRPYKNSYYCRHGIVLRLYMGRDCYAPALLPLAWPIWDRSRSLNSEIYSSRNVVVLIALSALENVVAFSVSLPPSVSRHLGNLLIARLLS